MTEPQQDKVARDATDEVVLIPRSCKSHATAVATPHHLLRRSFSSEEKPFLASISPLDDLHKKTEPRGPQKHKIVGTGVPDGPREEVKR